jgi:ABC-2 type transport system ATP-binding protein
MNVIEIDHLYKSYGSLSILHDLSLRVAEGEVYGLVGGHGSGKSTLLHLLLGFLKPSAGALRVLGTSDLDMARQRVGYMPERMHYHLRFTAREYLRFLGQFSDLHGKWLRRRVDEQLRQVELEHMGDRKLSTFSKGMLQRLGVAQALLANPEVLLLDEPLGALDATDQRDLIDILTDLRTQGHTILVGSHYTDALAQLCDRIGILTEGTLVTETHIRALRQPGGSVRIQVDRLTPGMSLHLSRLAPNISCSEQRITIQHNTPEIQARVLRTLLDANIAVLALEPLEHPLEQFYLHAIHHAEPTSDTPERHTPREPDEHDPLLDSLLLGEADYSQSQAPRDD